MKTYFKYHCQEPLLKEEWGWSKWYFEIDEDGYCSRQMELYETGPDLRYDVNKSEDEFGGLGQGKIEGEFKNDLTPISHSEFEQVWHSKVWMNRVNT